jgi:hypothetical protein
MKKLCLVSIVLFLVCAANAQTEYSVPAPTMEEKLNMTKLVMNNTILALITVAKNEGMSAEEFGKKCGAVFIPAWDENGGYEQFVNFELFNWACSADDVQIIEQSDEKLVVMVSSMYQPLEEQGVLFGSSVEDYTAYFNAVMNEIADHYNQSFEMTWGEEGYRIVITL